MSESEVAAVLSDAYPSVEVHIGDWSGGAGYIEYKLDDRYVLSISAMMRNGQKVIQDDVLIYIFDWAAKRRLDIRIDEWEKPKK